MLRLIPFDPSFADYVFKFYYEPEYAHFARGAGRYLTRYECEHLPEFRNREVLIPLYDERPCGIILLFRYEPDVIFGSLAIDKEFQGKKIMYEIEEAMTDYCYKIAGVEIGRMEILSKDKWLIDALCKVGWSVLGEIPKYTKVNGEYEDVTFVYKSKRK